jgi:hypothetical protein
MQNDNLISLLKKENEQLQFELNDLEYLISLREEELMMLKNKVASINELQSRYDQQLYHMEQLQHFVKEEQKKNIGAVKRENATEEELIQSIAIEKEYYSLQEQLKSSMIALEDTNNQLTDAVGMYKKLKDMKNKIASLESSLEIAQLDNQFLKEELEEIKAAGINFNTAD